MPKLISTRLFIARVGAAAVLPAVVMFLFASLDSVDDPLSGAWLLLAPVGWGAVVFVGWLDGKFAVAITAALCGMIFAIAAHVERDDPALPLCKEVTYRRCNNDADPADGVAAALWVLVPGEAVALMPAGRRRRAAKTAELETR